MVFWEYKTELFWFFSATEGTDVVVNLMDDDVWGYEDELTGVLSENVGSWDWLSLQIRPMSFPMTNSRTNEVKW